MTDAIVAARFLVSGRVQGVFYRASAQTQALSIGLRGWTRNLPDGRVEVFAAGTEQALDALQRWLAQGPPMAAVDTVERQPGEPAEAPATFEIRR